MSARRSLGGLGRQNVLTGFGSVMGSLVGTSAERAVTSAVARLQALTREVLSTWSRPVMAIEFSHE